MVRLRILALFDLSQLAMKKRFLLHFSTELFYCQLFSGDDSDRDLSNDIAAYLFLSTINFALMSFLYMERKIAFFKFSFPHKVSDWGAVMSTSGFVRCGIRHMCHRPMAVAYQFPYSIMYR